MNQDMENRTGRDQAISSSFQIQLKTMLFQVIIESKITEKKSQGTNRRERKTTEKSSLWMN